VCLCKYYALYSNLILCAGFDFLQPATLGRHGGNCTYARYLYLLFQCSSVGKNSYLNIWCMIGVGVISVSVRLLSVSVWKGGAVGGGGAHLCQLPDPVELISDHRLYERQHRGGFLKGTVSRDGWYTFVYIF